MHQPRIDAQHVQVNAEVNLGRFYGKNFPEFAKFFLPKSGNKVAYWEERKQNTLDFLDEISDKSGEELNTLVLGADHNRFSPLEIRSKWPHPPLWRLKERPGKYTRTQVHTRESTHTPHERPRCSIYAKNESQRLAAEVDIAE